MTAGSVWVLHIGIIGAGVAGERQAAGFRASAGCTLVGVSDADTKRAAGFAARFGLQVFAVPDLLQACDAIVVASPAGTHGTLGLMALQAGKHVLVERPIATDRDQARAMIAMAAQTGRVLQVGHREGPLLTALGLGAEESVGENSVRLFEAVREAPPREHALDVSVILDLMVQDLFVAATLFQAPAVSVRAQKTGGRGAMIDAAEARVRFKGGGEAKLRASRTATVRTTQWKVDFSQGHIAVDFVRGTLDNKREMVKSTERKVGSKLPAKALSGELPLFDLDPVAQNAQAFVAACNGLEPAPENGIALAALDLALHIETILRDKSVL